MTHRSSLLYLLALLFFASAAPAATPDEYYKAGLSFYQKADYQNAIKYLKAAVQTDPSHWQANQVLGYSYYQIHDPESALAAIDQSLQTHPDNPNLRAFADRIRPSSALPLPVTSATAPPPGLDLAPAATPVVTPVFETPTAFRNGKWANFHLGPFIAAMTDFQKGAQAIRDNFLPANASASSNNLGLMVGGEGGFCFDNRNSIGAAINVGFFTEYRDTYDFGGSNNGTDTFRPIIGEIQLKYYHILPIGTSRLRLGAGPGLYFSSVDVQQTQNGTSVVSGPMMGYGFGGGASVSWEFYLNKNLMLNVFAQGRFASTSHIQGKFQDVYGYTYDVGIYKDSYGILGTADISTIGTGSGRDWVNLDLTGGDAGIGITYHY